MLASIHPLGERARHNRWGVTVSFYLAGSMLGGAAMGAGLGLLGTPLATLPPGFSSILILAGCVVAILIDLRRQQIVGPRRQVDQAWLTRYRGWVYGLGFGFQLGMGVATIVTSASVYLVWLAALLSGSLKAGTLIGIIFGLSRAAVLLGGGRMHDPARIQAFHRVLAAWEGRARLITVAAMAALGLVVGL